jgi:Flp pilus assembly pilin Flp
MLKRLLELHRSDQGAEGLEKLLIVAAIVLPLLGVLLIFRKTISEWVDRSWTAMIGKSDIPNPDPKTGGTG